MAKFTEQKTRENLGKVFDYADEQIKRHHGHIYKGIKQECEKICDSDYYKLDDLKLVKDMGRSKWVDMIISRYPSFGKAQAITDEQHEKQDTDITAGAKEHPREMRYEQTTIDFEIEKGRMFAELDDMYKELSASISKVSQIQDDICKKLSKLASL